MWAQSLGWLDTPGGNGNAFQYFAWKIHGWEPGGLQSLGVHEESRLARSVACTHTHVCTHGNSADSKGNQKIGLVYHPKLRKKLGIWGMQRGRRPFTGK